ncbi:MAG: hypothetical protein ABEJ93_04305, partial [Candidatus Nanohalobium sp.]
MAESSLKSKFTNYIDKDSVFKNKEALTTNWKPDEILHRDQQINDLASIMAPALKGDDPSNVFIYGSVGTGKCVHPETTVLTSKGPREIKELFDSASVEERVKKNGEEVLKPKDSVKVLTYSENMDQEVKE